MLVRHILHIDLDAFFASVEQRDCPTLRGKPVLVGGSQGRGVVAAASYEARSFGIRSAMPIREALARCPEAIVVAPNMESYRAASESFFTILESFSPLVEGLSIDEAFVDISGCERLLGTPETIAATMKERVREEVGLVASVGIGPTKFVAKIASDIRKPDGLCIVAHDQTLAFLHPLPVTRLWGVGAVRQKKLARLGLTTIGDVARYPRRILVKKLGESLGTHIAELAAGRDPRDVVCGREALSIGSEQTFEIDQSSRQHIEAVLQSQCDSVAHRLRARGLRAKTIVLKIKYGDFTQVTRRKSLHGASSDGDLLFRATRDLLGHLAIGNKPGRAGLIRLCGVSAAHLEARDAPRQLTFDDATREQGENLGDILDAIEERFGSGSVTRANRPTKNDD